MTALEKFNSLQKTETKSPKNKGRFAKYDIHKKTGERSPRQKQTKLLDTYFKLWVRLSNSDLNGIVRCYTCGKYRHYKDNIHGGHYMGAARFPTRWDPKNVKPQCFKCNNTGEGESEMFAIAIDKEYGKGTADFLKLISLKKYTYDSFKVDVMIKYYRSEVNKLKNERGDK